MTITNDKIEEWLKEVEERPSSAPAILRYIANRLKDLSERIEQLRAENIELRTGRKVEEYETRIVNLEYQVELLKRQLGSAGAITPVEETASLIFYTPTGQVLRVELAAADLADSDFTAGFLNPVETGQELRLLGTSSQEELLFIFDSGRTATLPVTGIPPAAPSSLEWEQAFLQEPRAGEELAAVLPVARMSLFEFCIQTSRRAFVKKIREDFFETHLSNQFIGSGVKLAADRTCDLVFCSKDDLFVVVSREGFVFSIEAERLPLTIEEAMRLGPADHVVSTFVPGGRPALLIATQTGKVIHRETSWLEPAGSFKSRGQPAFSNRLREAGVQVVGAYPAAPDDWTVSLGRDGRLRFCTVDQVTSSGAVPGGERAGEIVGFTVFSPPSLSGKSNKASGD